MGELSEAMNCILNELITTEKTFVEDMKLVVNEYMIPAQTTSIPGFGHDKWDLIFNNIREIVMYHVTFLSNIEEWWPDVGSSFVDLSANFEMYYQYFSTFEEAIKMLNDAAKSNPALAAWLVARQRSLGLALGLEAYLLKPIQRVLKYQMLLENMLKQTSSNDPTYGQLVLAYNAIKNMQRELNEAQRKMDYRTNMLKMITGLPAVCSDYAMLGLRVGAMLLETNTFEDDRGRLRERHIFLFENAIIVCKPMGAFGGPADKFQYRYGVHMRWITSVQQVPETPDHVTMVCQRLGLKEEEVPRDDVGISMGGCRVSVTFQMRGPAIASQWEGTIMVRLFERFLINPKVEEEDHDQSQFKASPRLSKKILSSNEIPDLMELSEGDEVNIDDPEFLTWINHATEIELLQELSASESKLFVEKRSLVGAQSLQKAYMKQNDEVNSVAVGAFVQAQITSAKMQEKKIEMIRDRIEQLKSGSESQSPDLDNDKAMELIESKEPGFWARVMYDFCSEEKGELDVNEDQWVWVISTHDEANDSTWWCVTVAPEDNEATPGYVPASYLQPEYQTDKGLKTDEIDSTPEQTEVENVNESIYHNTDENEARRQEREDKEYTYNKSMVLDTVNRQISKDEHDNEPMQSDEITNSQSFHSSTSSDMSLSPTYHDGAHGTHKMSEPLQETTNSQPNPSIPLRHNRSRSTVSNEVSPFTLSELSGRRKSTSVIHTQPPAPSEEGSAFTERFKRNQIRMHKPLVRPRSRVIEISALPKDIVEPSEDVQQQTVAPTLPIPSMDTPVPVSRPRSPLTNINPPLTAQSPDPPTITPPTPTSTNVSPSTSQPKLLSTSTSQPMLLSTSTSTVTPQPRRTSEPMVATEPGIHPLPITSESNQFDDTHTDLMQSKNTSLSEVTIYSSGVTERINDLPLNSTDIQHEPHMSPMLKTSLSGRRRRTDSFIGRERFGRLSPDNTVAQTVPIAPPRRGSASSEVAQARIPPSITMKPAIAPKPRPKIRPDLEDTEIKQNEREVECKQVLHTTAEIEKLHVDDKESALERERWAQELHEKRRQEEIAIAAEQKEQKEKMMEIEKQLNVAASKADYNQNMLVKSESIMKSDTALKEVNIRKGIVHKFAPVHIHRQSVKNMKESLPEKLESTDDNAEEKPGALRRMEYQNRMKARLQTALSRENKDISDDVTDSSRVSDSAMVSNQTASLSQSTHPVAHRPPVYPRPPIDVASSLNKTSPGQSTSINTSANESTGSTLATTPSREFTISSTANKLPPKSFPNRMSMRNSRRLAPKPTPQQRPRLPPIADKMAPKILPKPTRPRSTIPTRPTPSSRPRTPSPSIAPKPNLNTTSLPVSDPAAAGLGENEGHSEEKEHRLSRSLKRLDSLTERRKEALAKFDGLPKRPEYTDRLTITDPKNASGLGVPEMVPQVGAVTEKTAQRQGSMSPLDNLNLTSPVPPPRNYAYRKLSFDNRNGK